MKKEFNRFPPTTDGMPKMKPDNMANITLKYCREYRNIEDLLLSFCDFPNDLLPDVLIVNGLDEYFESKDNTIQFCFARMLSLLSETVEYIGRRKNTKSLLYVSYTRVPWCDIKIKMFYHYIIGERAANKP